MQRVLNSFLQFLEQDDSESLIVAATNHPRALDYALFRRFDDVIEYILPDKSLAVKLMKNRLALYVEKDFDFANIAEEAKGLSFADIARACEDAVKDALIHNRAKILVEDITGAVSERKVIRDKCFYPQETPDENGRS